VKRTGISGTYAGGGFRFTPPSLRRFGVLCGLVAILTGTGDAASERPNVLLIVSEDNGPELGCYGDPYVKTPRLDQLAVEGCRFENAFVPHPVYSVSRAAFLTGLDRKGQTWNYLRDD
jgi:hypothetical protein